MLELISVVGMRLSWWFLLAVILRVLENVLEMILKSGVNNTIHVYYKKCFKSTENRMSVGRVLKIRTPLTALSILLEIPQNPPGNSFKC